jgi:uncharacterized membrane protein
MELDRHKDHKQFGTHCTGRTDTLQVSIQTTRDLPIIAALALSVIVVTVFVPVHALRIALGLPYVCFLPGYAILAALFPGSDDLKNAERTALSFGLSIAIVPLIGLLLNYTTWGIQLGPVLVSITLFILACCVVAHYRRSRLPPEKHFVIHLEFDLSHWRDIGWLDIFLSVALTLFIITTVGTLVYAITKPKVGERFTEFYILGPEGLAENYPREAVVGQPVTVTVGIANHEGVPAEYRLVVISEEYLIGQAEPVRLEPGETDERPVSFVPMVAGDDVQVVFWLYREGVEGSYRSLRLWLKVTE